MSTGERRLFTVNAPDWGQTHLTSDAVVAFVDDELARRPHDRATQHVAACPDCAAEVVAQRQARTALRGASGPALPSSLLSSLRAIPQDTDLPAPPVGLAVTELGELVSVLEPEPSPVTPPEARPSATSARRLRFGAGAAVSGLTIGALALGAATIPAVPVPTADRGVLGGSVVGPGAAVPARLGLDAGPAAEETRSADRNRIPRTFLR